MTTCNILQIKAQNDHLQHLITSEGVVLEQNNTSMTPIKIKNEDAIFRPSTRFPEKSTLPPDSLPSHPKSQPCHPKSLPCHPKSLPGFPKSLPCQPKSLPCFRKI